MKTIGIGLVVAGILIGAPSLALAQGTSGSGVTIRDNQTTGDPGLGASGGIGTMRGTDPPIEDKTAGSRFESSPPPGPIDPSGTIGSSRPGIVPTR